MDRDLQNSLRDGAATFEAWWRTVDHQLLLVAGLLLGVVILLRKPIARFAVGLVEKRFVQRSSGFEADLKKRLERLMQVLIIACCVFIVIEILNLPQFAGGLLRNIVATLAVIAVFATMYELSSNFVAMIMAVDFERVALESDWTTRVTRLAILIFGIAAVLEVWNVDISGALTGVGVLGAGMAIAAQDLVRNLIAGMTNQSEERFVTGDAIEVEGGFLGTVKRIDIRSTLILGFDQVPRYVPNAELANSVVKNYSRMEHRRVMATFQISLSATRTQIEAIRHGLEDYLHSSGDFDVSSDAPKYVHITSIGQSSVDLQFYALTNSGVYEEYIAVHDRLALKAKDLVAEAGTAFAHPIQTVHLVEPGAQFTGASEP